MTFTTRNPSFVKKKPTTFQAGDRAGLMMWVKQRQAQMALEDLVWGRIKDTGTNFIVEGWSVRSGTNRTEWVRIPCQNLATAQMYLISIMDKQSFNAEQLRQRLDRAQKKVDSDKLIQEILSDIF